MNLDTSLRPSRHGVTSEVPGLHNRWSRKEETDGRQYVMFHDHNSGNICNTDDDDGGDDENAC